LAIETLKSMLANGLEIATTLLAFALAIFVILVFGVRLLMIARKVPVPTSQPTPLTWPSPRISGY
jgi:hypothetical protein